MATVYITKELINHVKKRIAGMCNRETELEVPKWNSNVEIDASELVMQAAWGDHLPLSYQLPKDWLRKSTQQTLNIVDHTPDGVEVKYRIDVATLGSFFERPSNDRWGAPTPSCTKQWVESKLHLTGAQEILDRIAEKEVEKTISAKWSKINDDIEMFLNKCKSLNEALRLWPTLRIYIPDEFMIRINTKVERRKRETEIIESIDIEELTASAIAARLSGAV